MSGNGERVGGLRGDRDTLAWLEGAAGNRAARTQKQARDAERIRVRLDVPREVKAALERVAAELGTSASQAGAYLLCDALIGYFLEQPELPLLPSRSPRVEWNVDLGVVLERLRISAEGSECRE